MQMADGTGSNLISSFDVTINNQGLRILGMVIHPLTPLIPP